MSGFGYEEFAGFDGARVLPPRNLDSVESLTDLALEVERHYVSEGARHARLLTREVVMASAVGINYDLSEAVDAFSGGDWLRQTYAEGLCEGMAEHAAEIRGLVAMSDLALPDKGFGDPTDVARLLTREQQLQVAGTLEDLSGHLALRVGIAEPWRLHVVGWMPKAEPVPDMAVRTKAARPAVQRMRAVNLARSQSREHRPDLPVARSQVRLMVFKGVGR